MRVATRPGRFPADTPQPEILPDSSTAQKLRLANQTPHNARSFKYGQPL